MDHQANLLTIVVAGVGFNSETTLTEAEVVAYGISAETNRGPVAMIAEESEVMEGLQINRERYCKDGDDSFMRGLIRQNSPIGNAALNHVIRLARARKKEAG